jgi:hypothetical protein
MGKHQLTRIAAELRAGQWPVVTTDEIGALAGFKPGDRRTYALLWRLKDADVIKALLIRSAYLVCHREVDNTDRFRAWLRLHPGQGVLEEVQIDDQGRSVGPEVPRVMTTLGSSTKGLSNYCSVRRFKNLPLAKWEVDGLPVLKRTRSSLQ